MAQLVLAGGPSITARTRTRPSLKPAARPAKRRSQSRKTARAGRLSHRLRLAGGYGVFLAVALVALTINRLDFPAGIPTGVPAENWGQADTEFGAEPDAASGREPGVESGPDRSRTYAGPVRVVDGDTLDLGGERIRLANIDAPEMPPKSQCASEARGAQAATARLNSLVRQGPLTLERKGEDRYGRTLAHVYVDGADAGRTLIAAGLARPWEGKRRSWCV